MKKYIIYGSSILFGRGLEYLVLLIAPLYLSKEEYGGLEFYKKVIELGAAMLTFGLPTLLLSYPRSTESKKYLTFISLLFISFLTIIVAPFLFTLKYLVILIPVYFHSIFFNNGIIPPFILTSRGSNSASIYKIITSILFYIIVFISIFYLNNPKYSFVYVSYILLPVFLVYTIWSFYKENIVFSRLKKYFTLFKRLLIGSFTIVMSNFANMMFLYTDILIIKILSDNANIAIANYSFSLNTANALILIPLTLVQVDIEKLKVNKNYISTLNKKIVFFVFTLSLLLLVLFIVLTNTYFVNYKSTLIIFVIILSAKVFQSLSVLYGAQIIIKKQFLKNLIINTIALLTNIILSYLLFFYLGLMGIAIASLVSLFLRYVVLVSINQKI